MTSLNRNAEPRWVRSFCWIAVGGLLFAAACATRESNPSRPSANHGYVDFYADPPLDVYWKIEQLDRQESVSRVLYSEFKAPSNGVLRLELAPGTYHLKVAFMNYATEGPTEVDVLVTPEKITPVRIKHEAAGSTYVRDVDDKARNPGRMRKVTDYQQQIYKLAAEAGAPEGYQVKERMSYAH